MRGKVRGTSEKVLGTSEKVRGRRYEGHSYEIV